MQTCSKSTFNTYSLEGNSGNTKGKEGGGGGGIYIYDSIDSPESPIAREHKESVVNVRASHAQNQKKRTCITFFLNTVLIVFDYLIARQIHVIFE